MESVPLRKIAHNEWHVSQLQRRVYPSEWREVDSGLVDPRTDALDPPFENSWVNSGGSLTHLQFRDSGFGTVDLEGVVTGGAVPSIVTTIPLAYPLPIASLAIPGTGFFDWQLDPDGSLWVVGAGTAPTDLESLGDVVITSPATGDALVWDGSEWVNSPFSNGELDYVEFTSNQACTATTEAGANTVVSANSVSFDGATTVLIEFFCATWSQSSTTQDGILALYDGSGSIGQIWQGNTPRANAGASGIYVVRRLTPSNASHTYSIRGYVSAASTFTLYGASGGSGARMPGFIRITQV